MLCCMNEIAAQGKLTFETETINVGTVSTAEPFAYYYCSFKNTGDKPIGINTVINPTRMLAKYSKEMIQPGAQGKIEIQHDVQDAHPGLFRKVITIRTSDGAVKRIRLSGTISDEIPSKQRRKDNIEWYRTFENGKYGATTINGEIIIPPICSKITNNRYGFWAEKEGIHAFYDCTGKNIIPFGKGYTDIRCFTKRLGTYFNVRKANYSALCNQSGQVVYYLSENGIMEPFYCLGRFVVILLNEGKYKIFDYEKNCISAIKLPHAAETLYIDDEGNICSSIFGVKQEIIGNIKKAVISKNPFAQ